MTKDLLKLAETALSRAKHFGATAADALVIDGHSLEVGVREGSIENLEQSEACEIGLRVLVGKSSAAIATSKIDAAGIERIAEQAVAMAKAAPADPYAGIASADEIARDWAPGFTIDLQQKDLRIALDAADHFAAPMPGVALVFQLYRALQNRGLGGEGNHAIIKALEELAGRELGSTE